MRCHLWLKTEDSILHGYMDFVCFQDTTIYIVDFKTDAVEEKELKQRYKEQLGMYHKALKILYPTHKIQPAIYSLHLHKMINI